MLKCWLQELPLSTRRSRSLSRRHQHLRTARSHVCLDTSSDREHYLQQFCTDKATALTTRTRRLPVFDTSRGTPWILSSSSAEVISQQLCPEDTVRKTENGLAAMGKWDSSWYMYARGCSLWLQQQAGTSRNHGVAWRGSLPLPSAVGIAPWQCPGPVQPLTAKGLHLQASPQPGTARQLLPWYQDMCKGQPPGISNACLQPAMSFTCQQPSSPLPIYLDILWWQKTGSNMPFVPSREVSISQTARHACRADKSLLTACANSYPLILPQMSKNSTWSQCTCGLPSPDKSTCSFQHK